MHSLDETSEGVARTLLSAMAGESEDLLICGARQRPRNMAFLAGTVSDRLLRDGASPTLCLRVVHPGIAGQPERLLLPLAGHPRGAGALLPVLRLFNGDLTHLDLLLVQPVPRWQRLQIDADLRARAQSQHAPYLGRVADEIREGLRPWSPTIHKTIALSADPPQEIVKQANAWRSQLILLGASERSLFEKTFLGRPAEQVMRAAPTDVAIFRAAR